MKERKKERTKERKKERIKKRKNKGKKERKNNTDGHTLYSYVYTLYLAE